MNKISLFSLALSVAFCGALSATEQSAPSDIASDNSDVISTETPAIETTDSESVTKAEEIVKKPKITKKRRGKKCYKSKHKAGDKFTEKLNNGESLDVDATSGVATAEPSKDEPKAN